MEEKSKKGLLVVSFGTSFPESRKKHIEAIERSLAEGFPDRTFYRAWTSGFIIKKVLKTEGLAIDTVEKALERMRSEGITDVLMQPTHLLFGEENDKMLETAERYRDSFERIAVGKPLLAGEEDRRELARGIAERFSFVSDKEAVALMGHGSAKIPGDIYLEVQSLLRQQAGSGWFVGTVEFEPGSETMLKEIRAMRPQKVYLAPLMVVAGDHANNDMGGDEEDSWASRIGAMGIRTECFFEGLGEYEHVRRMFMEHARRAEPL